MSLKDKLVVITGASRGMGREISISIANEGAKVVLIGRTKSELNKLSDEIGNANASVISIDISNEELVKKAVEEVSNKYGRIDFLINNAGVGYFKNLEKFSEEEWDSVMSTNVKGTFLMSKHIVPLMKKEKSGHILTIASDVSKRTFAEGSVYCASKYAQDALMSSLRSETRSFGIKVSVIYPGLVDTYFGDSDMGGDHKKDWLKTKDIADAVMYVLNTPKNVVVDELMIHPMTQEY